jgi:rhombotail lipoprotein
MRSAAAGFLLCLLLVGCGTTQTRHTSTSVVDFIYPNVKEPVVAPGTPELRLPRRVGIAFVPTLGSGAGSVNASCGAVVSLSGTSCGHPLPSQ